MTPMDLIETMAKFCEKVLSDYEMVAEYQGEKKISIYRQNIPIPNFRNDTFLPCVVVSVEKVIDTEDFESVAILVLTIQVYGGENEEGWRDLFNIAERLRQMILLNPMLGEKYPLELPVEFEVSEYLEQPKPFFIGELAMAYKVGTPRVVLR